MDNKDKKRKFKWLDLGKEGAGVSKTASELNVGFKRFFVSYKENFSKFVSINIFFVLGNFPLLFLIATLSGVTKNDAYMPMSDLFQNIGTIFAVEGDYTPFKMSVLALEGLQSQILVNTTLTYVFYGISLLSLITFGLVNVGTAYILRNIAMGEPVFLWTDFWYAIKRNWKQALPYGIIDILICVILGTNIYNMLMGSSDFFASLLFWANVVIAIAYLFMRPYMYIQMVSFNMSVFKMFKNSLIFVLLGIKGNLLSLLANILLIVLELMFLFGTGGLLVPVAVAAPLAIIFSTMAYAKVFPAYFKIKEIMIDPYYKDHPEEKPEEFDDDPIMIDDVTERERLEAIKASHDLDLY